MEQKSLWNKDFLLDTGINFVVYLIYYLLMVIIAVVAKDQLNASLSEAGLASGIFIVGTLLARLQFGKAIELYTRRRTLYGPHLVWRDFILPDYDIIIFLYSEFDRHVFHPPAERPGLRHCLDGYQHDYFRLHPGR